MVSQFMQPNPILHRLETIAKPSSQVMGIRGVMIKTATLLAVVFLGALGALIFESSSIINTALVWGGIATVILALFTLFLPKLAWITAPIYAFVQGILLGSISLAIEMIFPGIVINAILLTILLLLAMCGFYIFFPVASHRLVPYVFGVTAALGLVYFVDFILNLFGFGVPYLHASGIIGIIIAIAILALATLNLLGDFSFIDERIRRGEGKEYEWYAAFGLVVTLLWMYLRVIQLLALFARERKS
ncbi:MAG: Bax inhibitor-1/YccA family membrane protein [Culicoidibacterales bacterium]